MDAFTNDHATSSWRAEQTANRDPHTNLHRKWRKWPECTSCVGAETASPAFQLPRQQTLHWANLACCRKQAAQHHEVHLRLTCAATHREPHQHDPYHWSPRRKSDPGCSDSSDAKEDESTKISQIKFMRNKQPSTNSEKSKKQCQETARSKQTQSARESRV